MIFIEFISYEGSFVATDGVAAGMTSVDIGISQSSSTAVGTSLQLTRTGCNKSDFTWIKDASETKLSTNQGQTISCVSTVTIHESFLVIFHMKIYLI